MSLSEDEAMPGASTRVIFALADYLKFQSSNSQSPVGNGAAAAGPSEDDYQEQVHLYDIA